MSINTELQNYKIFHKSEHIQFYKTQTQQKI